MPATVPLYDLKKGEVLPRRAIAAREAVLNGGGRYTIDKPSPWPPEQRWKEPEEPSAPAEVTGDETVATAPETSGAGGPKEPEGPAADDFTQIKGIGQGIAKRIVSAGIRTFEALAALTPAQVDDIISFPGKNAKTIGKEAWVEQARELAAGLPSPE